MKQTIKDVYSNEYKLDPQGKRGNTGQDGAAGPPGIPGMKGEMGDIGLPGHEVIYIATCVMQCDWTDFWMTICIF